MQKKLKFIIVSPLKYSGGTIVLHTLCRNLIELGYNARMYYVGNTNLNCSKIILNLRHLKNNFTYYINKLFFKIGVFRNKYVSVEFYKGSIKRGTKIKFFNFVLNKKNTVVVYPEVYNGTCFNKTKNVRWFLYFNRHQNSTTWYNSSDFFICYRPIFNDKELNPEMNTLYLSYYDLDLYKRYNYGERTGNCYIIRKGKNRDDLPENFDGYVVDDLDEFEKVKVFNECEQCICYDTQTAYSSIASLCGCKTIVIPEKNKTRRDYLGENDLGYGISFGFDDGEMKYAEKTRDLLYNEFIRINKDSIIETKKFIELCNKKMR